MEGTKGRASAIRISAPDVARLLGAGAAALIAINVVLLWAWFAGTGWVRPGVLRLFYVDSEQNLPSFYSALLLFLPAAAVGVVAALKRRAGARYARHWAVLSLAFLYLSFDEAASLHEAAIGPMRELLGPYASGVLWYAWVAPASLAVAVFGLSYLRFLWALPVRTRCGMIASGIVYLAGALGMEMAGSNYAFRHGVDTFAYAMLSTIEESLEMAGLVWFLYMVLDYLGRVYGAVTVELGGVKPANASAEREPPGPGGRNAELLRSATRESLRR